MPRIILKHKSPEYADLKGRQETCACDMPGCAQTAEHKAPKHRGLNEYYRFCLFHVQEYNKAWDFFSGMAASEVESHMEQSLYGDRPTWRYDTYARMEEHLRQKAEDFAGFEEKNGRKEEPVQNRNTPEFEALAIMGLEPPTDLPAIKSRYKELAKKHHPDLNPGCNKSEELLKRINMAYTVLKLSYARFETLPDRA